MSKKIGRLIICPQECGYRRPGMCGNEPTCVHAKNFNKSCIHDFIKEFPKNCPLQNGVAIKKRRDRRNCNHFLKSNTPLQVDCQRYSDRGRIIPLYCDGVNCGYYEPKNK